MSREITTKNCDIPPYTCIIQLNEFHPPPVPATMQTVAVRDRVLFVYEPGTVGRGSTATTCDAR